MPNMKTTTPMVIFAVRPGHSGSRGGAILLGASLLGVLGGRQGVSRRTAPVTGRTALREEVREAVAVLAGLFRSIACRASDRLGPFDDARMKLFLVFGLRLARAVVAATQQIIQFPYRPRQHRIDREAAIARLGHLLQAVQPGAEPTHAHGEGILSFKAAILASISVSASVRA
jgi:hypothetical protein